MQCIAFQDSAAVVGRGAGARTDVVSPMYVFLAKSSWPHRRNGKYIRLESCASNLRSNLLARGFHNVKFEMNFRLAGQLDAKTPGEVFRPLQVTHTKI